MKKTIISIAVLTISTLPALADFRTIAQSYELEPDHVNMPVAADSMMYFSECDACVTASARLTATTRFSVDGTAVDFPDFCDALLRAQESDHSAVILQRHLETNEIVYVQVAL